MASLVLMLGCWCIGLVDVGVLALLMLVCGLVGVGVGVSLFVCKPCWC